MRLDLINSYYLFLILGVPSPFSLAFCLPSRITLSSFFVLLELLFRIKLLALPTLSCNHSHLPHSDLPPSKTKASNGLPDTILQIIFHLLIFFSEAFQGATFVPCLSSCYIFLACFHPYPQHLYQPGSSLEPKPIEYPWIVWRDLL